MKRNELQKLRSLFYEEVNRRKTINDLLDNNLVQLYLHLNKIEPANLDSFNYEEIVRNILKDFKITESNGIYVCTSAYQIGNSDNYDCDYTINNLPINSNNAEYKLYQDIETGDRIQAANNANNHLLVKVLIPDFEESHIVLNPFNSCENNNGYQLVRNEFFINSIMKSGQAESKKILLKKYNRL